MLGQIGYTIPFHQQDVREICKEYSHAKFQLLLQDQVVDRILGSIFGAFMGDALGAFLQFQTKINEDLINEAMKMRGGGTFDLRPGQVTDDSQLSYHLLLGLSTYDSNRDLNEQMNNVIANICLEYIKWKKSRPFDIGNTCRVGINKIQQFKKELEEPETRWSLEKSIGNLYHEVQQLNSGSQSNGSLMRVAPLTFLFALMWPQQQKADTLTLVEKQVKLLHPNKEASCASKIWSKLLRCLINRQSDKQLKIIYKYIMEETRKSILADWVKAVDDKQPMNGVTNMGWSKIAWTYGLRALKQLVEKPIDYDRDIFSAYVKDVLRRGGDTDTNASILGGMLGAITGFKRLPEKYITTMMELRFPPEKKQKKSDRAVMYQPRYFFARAFELIERFTSKGTSNKNK